VGGGDRAAATPSDVAHSELYYSIIARHLASIEDDPAKS